MDPDLPPPGSDAWCDYLAEWNGNISKFPTLVTDELVQQCLLNDVSREYIETTPTYQWLALVLLVIPLAGVLGNSLVCIAVWQERRLHNVTNFFLVSLALADLMVCLAVMPFGVLELFYGELQPAVFFLSSFFLFLFPFVRACGAIQRC